MGAKGKLDTWGPESETTDSETPSVYAGPCVAHAHTHTHTHSHTYICIHVHEYIDTCIHTCMHACINYINVCVYIYIYTCPLESTKSEGIHEGFSHT